MAKPLTFGQIKVYAHRFLKGQAIPVFDRATNRAIDRHVERIERARTNRRRA